MHHPLPPSGIFIYCLALSCIANRCLTTSIYPNTFTSAVPLSSRNPEPAFVNTTDFFNASEASYQLNPSFTANVARGILLTSSLYVGPQIFEVLAVPRQPFLMYDEVTSFHIALAFNVPTFVLRYASTETTGFDWGFWNSPKLRPRPLVMHTGFDWTSLFYNLEAAYGIMRTSFLSGMCTLISIRVAEPGGKTVDYLGEVIYVFSLVGNPRAITVFVGAITGHVGYVPRGCGNGEPSLDLNATSAPGVRMR